MPLSPRLPRSPLLLQLAPWLWRWIFTFTTPILKGCTYSPSVGEVCMYHTISCGSAGKPRMRGLDFLFRETGADEKAAIWRRAEETQQTRVALDRFPLADTEDNTIEQQRTDSRYCGPRRHAALRSVYASWRPLNRTHCDHIATAKRQRCTASETILTGLLYCVGSGGVPVFASKGCLLVNATYTGPGSKAIAGEVVRAPPQLRQGAKDWAVCRCLDSLVNPTTSGRHSTTQPKTLGPELSSSEERDGKEPQRNLAVRIVQKHFLVAAAAAAAARSARSAHKPKKLIFDELEEFTSCVPGPTASRHPTTEPTTPWWPKMGYGKGKRQPSPES
ncbi:hypothetical protein CSAL01_11778 [Colletotrichum salicis]|uniref:Uncharacterized protein n=1 Tax=Colletotrichum salicis TaxID=1209931 RepID=A0A135UI14_9PEZI|nr:hypothetical protein CSAL01_11778 [Colletotrichum salicis]